MKYFLLLFCLSLTCLLRSQVSMTDTLHFQSYNLLNFENEPGNDRSDHFRTIINEIRPDVLAVQELIELSGANMFLDSVLLPLDTNYALATFIASYDTDRGLYYRKDKYEFISSESIDTELRDINQVKLRHTGSDMEFIVFILHLKASNGEESQRAREVDSLRKVTDLLPDSIPFIVCGDFNMYDENEPGYLGLLDMSASGYVIDPLQDSLTTTWNNSANTRFHTQSTRTTNFGGGSTGGLDDRFDMILFNQMIADPGGMDYVDGSTYPYGNDGNHYNEAINAMPNTAVSVEVANALHQASDHLTLIAQFTFTYEVDTTEEDTTIVHLPAMEQEFHVTVYPQPANDVVFIETGQEFTYTWISDLQGRELSEPQRLISTRSQLDVSGYTPGIYLLHVVGESQHLTRPLLIAN